MEGQRLLSQECPSTPVRKPTVTTVSQSAYYLQQAEECERQAAIAKLKSTGQSFLSAAAQWRGVAANELRRQAIDHHATYATGASTELPGRKIDGRR
jgi:hypothetical protein